MGAVGWGLLFFGIGIGALRAEDERYARQDVELAFLVRMVDFARWESAAATDTDFIRVGVFESPTVLRRFRELLTRSHQEDRVFPVLIDLDASEAELAALRVVYFPEAESEAMATMLKRLEGRPVLSLGSGSGFLEKGGIVRFDLEEGRIAFDINASRAKRNGIEFSPRLLQLARRIHDSSEQTRYEAVGSEVFLSLIHDPGRACVGFLEEGSVR